MHDYFKHNTCYSFRHHECLLLCNQSLNLLARPVNMVNAAIQSSKKKKKLERLTIDHNSKVTYFRCKLCGLSNFAYICLYHRTNCLLIFPTPFSRQISLYQPPTLFITKYSGTSENRLSLLRKPPQCGQESAVPNYSLCYSVCT